jgi:hypothetical protein
VVAKRRVEAAIDVFRSLAAIFVVTLDIADQGADMGRHRAADPIGEIAPASANRRSTMVTLHVVNRRHEHGLLDDGVGLLALGARLQGASVEEPRREPPLRNMLRGDPSLVGAPIPLATSSSTGPNAAGGSTSKPRITDWSRPMDGTRCPRLTSWPWMCGAWTTVAAAGLATSWCEPSAGGRGRRGDADGQVTIPNDRTPSQLRSRRPLAFSGSATVRLNG